MRHLKLLFLALLPMSLVSCVDAAPRAATPRDTTPKIPRYQQIINNWTGLLVEDLIREWGAPDKTFRIAGKEYIVYVNGSTITQPGSTGYYGMSGSSGYSYRVTNCTWTFEIRRGIIVNGNAVDGRKGGCAYAAAP